MFIDQQGRVVTSASDLTAATACEFSWLRQLDEKLGRIEAMERTEDAMLMRAAELGDVHEERVLGRYRKDASGRGRVVEIARPDVHNPESTQAAVQATLDAFRAGADVVFQATFAAVDDHGLPFVRFADFIVRRPDGSYRVQDTKLARSAKVTTLQLAASSAAEVPRRLGFLLMRNRLNVSIFRAKWKAYLVCSPALLEYLPNTP